MKKCGGRHSIKMKLDEFKIGRTFYMCGRKWLCTDKGTRTIATICLSNAVVVVNGTKQKLTEAELKSEQWTCDPPYSMAEQCLDEYDIETCTIRMPASSANAVSKRLKERQKSVEAGV